MTPTCPCLRRAANLLMGRERCLSQGTQPRALLPYPRCRDILSALGSCLGYSSPPLLEIRPIYSNFLFRECATCFEVIAPSSWKSFQLMGKNRKKAEKGGECKLVSWESGRNILVSLLYLATEGCGQIYNKRIPPRSQDRVKLTQRN